MSRHLGRRGSGRPALPILLGFVLLSLVLAPLFFDIYRITVFNVIQRDDYAPFLLYLVGDPNGSYAGSPRGYRILFALLAWPFYHLMPVLTFSDLPDDLPLPYIKATQALAAVAYLGITTSMLLSHVVASRLLASRVAAATAAVVVLILTRYAGFQDPVALAILFAAIALLDRPIAFGSLVLATLLVNEKIALTLALVLGLRFLVYPELRRVYLPHLAWVGLALAVYLLTVAIVQLPGNDQQLQPWTYWASFVSNLGLMMSARGLYLNVWPMALLTGIALIAWRGGGYDALTSRWFRPSDIGVIYLLALVGMLMNVQLNVGRIALFGSPFLVIPFAHAVALRFFAGPSPAAGEATGGTGAIPAEPATRPTASDRAER